MFVAVSLPKRAEMSRTIGCDVCYELRGQDLGPIIIPATAGVQM